jgi:uncharacterized protein YlzI (FlbEa/FlbD family)
MKIFYIIHDADMNGNPVYINSDYITYIKKWGDRCIIRTVDGKGFKTVESFSEIITMLR